MTWLTYALLAALFIGISMVFYKLPSYKNYSSFVSTIVTNFLSTIFIWIGIFCITGSLSATAHISWYGLAWGATFAVSMVLYKKLLSGREAGTIFPVVSSAGNTFTIVAGVVLLSEVLSWIQVVGIIIIFSSIYFFQRKEGKVVFNKQALLFALGIIVFSTAQKFIQKLGATNDTVYQFLAYQYLGAAITATVLTILFERSKLKELFAIRKYVRGALLISIFSVLGGYAILKALTTASLSEVYAVQPIYTFVTAMLGVWLFRERMDWRKVVFILLSIIGVILLRI